MSDQYPLKMENIIKQLKFKPQMFMNQPANPWLVFKLSRMLFTYVDQKLIPNLDILEWQFVEMEFTVVFDL